MKSEIGLQGVPYTAIYTRDGGHLISVSGLFVIKGYLIQGLFLTRVFDSSKLLKHFFLVLGGAVLLCGGGESDSVSCEEVFYV